jgi:hypothetical protein
VSAERRKREEVKERSSEREEKVDVGFVYHRIMVMVIISCWLRIKREWLLLDTSKVISLLAPRIEFGTRFK